MQTKTIGQGARAIDGTSPSGIPMQRGKLWRAIDDTKRHGEETEVETMWLRA
jgi:hypothetical protein